MDTRREFLLKTTAAGIAGIVAAGAAPVFAQNARVKRTGVSLEDARRVHRKCLIIDGHNDTPVCRIAAKENPLKWMERDMSYHTDIPRMKGDGQQYVGFFIVGNGAVANVWVTAERVLEDIAQYPDDLMPVVSSKDAVRAGKSGKVGVIMAIEGIGPWLDGKAEIQRIFYRLGVRLMGITHGEGGPEPRFLQGTQSSYGLCSPADRENERRNAGGLTPFGREILMTNDELGVVTDLSHINDRAFYDVLEFSNRPPIMSHTAVFACCNHWRCLTDDMMKALAARDGVMGIAFAPMFIDAEKEKQTIDRVVEHILYAVDLIGIDHVAIGTDYDGLGETPVVPEVSQLVNLTRCMMGHGLTEDEIRKIWGGNFLRILRKTIDA